MRLHEIISVKKMIGIISVGKNYWDHFRGKNDSIIYVGKNDRNHFREKMIVIILFGKKQVIFFFTETKT